MSDIVDRMRETTAKMALCCRVPMGLWQEHSAAVLQAANLIEQLERENAELKDREHRLQAALAYWMPGVTEAIEIELGGRAGDDALLLAGFEGEVPNTSWGDTVLERLASARSQALDDLLADSEAMDAARHLMQWMDMGGRPTEQRLLSHCSRLQRDPPEECRDVDHVPPRGLRTFWILREVVAAHRARRLAEQEGTE